MPTGQIEAGRLFPESAHQAYRGARASAFFLAVLSLAKLIPGAIHTFAPDGGAGTIAGLDLTQRGDTIVSLFAWAGATQIVWGAIMLAVAVRYRSLVPLVLALVLFEGAIHALNMWVMKPGAEGHHPPEAYATLAILPVIALFLALALRRR